MEQLEVFRLEEYAGHKFYVEHVSTIIDGNWFRVHMSNGLVHNLTICDEESIERARQEIIKQFKEYLDGGKN